MGRSALATAADVAAPGLFVAEYPKRAITTTTTVPIIHFFDGDDFDSPLIGAYEPPLSDF